jgi:uncharacterized protein (TIGR02996 family)
MTQEDAFLLDILENRDDDTPRRVYADWLLDRDDPVSAARGEFIHTQCDLARWPADTPRPAQLVQRERQLLGLHAREWGSLFQRLGCTCWEYRRGFVEGVGLPAHALLAQAGTLFRAAPVRELKLYGATRLLAQVAACPWLARVRVLDLEKNDLDDADLEALAGSPYLAELTTLLLWSNAVADAGVRALAGAAPGRLSRLDLSANAVGDAGVAALAQSPLMARLTLLDLTANQISDAGAAALTRSRHTARLTWLDLTKNPIGPTGQALLRERFGARVHVLG